MWLQKKVGPGLSANSSLEEQITEMEATISVVLNNHTSRITQMEYSSGVAEDAIANHTYEIAEIEKNRQSDVAEIQAHYARILGLEQADNESNAVLEIHAATLRNLGKAVTALERSVKIKSGIMVYSIDYLSYVTRSDSNDEAYHKRRLTRLWV